ncbi:MAG TPA: ABC transporter ATP-binding protein [Gemmatimonadales bacterium]|nr:ABC transporter ATP-binding protein [Gemmatimonadales bacterium]
MSIRLEQVSAHSGDHALLRDCSLEVAAGQRCVLLGREGSGKSSLIRVIAGAVPADHGRVLLFGREVTRVPAGQRPVSVVYRQPALFNRMTLLENVVFALGQRQPSVAARRRQAEELLGLVDLSVIADRYPAQVSGAERVRAAMARALGHDARVLLLESPADELAQRERQDLHAALDRIRQQLGTTVLLATADPDVALSLGDSIAVMSAGRVLEVGDPESLYLRPRTRFAARALGVANLLPGQSGREGVRVGNQLFPTAVAGRARGLAGEVTVLVRPEDVALTGRPSESPPPPAGSGVIERIETFGSIQRLHIARHTLGPESRLAVSAMPVPPLVVTRSASAAQAQVLVAGQDVAIEIRRIHVLPSQLGSLWICDGVGGDAESLARCRTVAELAAGMQLSPRPISVIPPGAALPSTGLCVTAGWGPRGVEAATRLLERGARQVLLLREPDRPANQMLMLAQSARAAREHMLSIGASVLRYLPMEAAMLVPDLHRPIRGGRYRMLLDLRRAALEHHGIDMRTELAGSDPCAGLAARLRRAEGQVLLVLGMASPRAARRMLDRVGAALGTARHLGAVLVTCARGEHAGSVMFDSIGDRDVA